MELSSAVEGPASEIPCGTGLRKGVQDYVRESLFVLVIEAGHKRIVQQGGDARLILRTNIEKSSVLLFQIVQPGSAQSTGICVATQIPAPSNENGPPMLTVRLDCTTFMPISVVPAGAH